MLNKQVCHNTIRNVDRFWTVIHLEECIHLGLARQFRALSTEEVIPRSFLHPLMVRSPL